MTGPNRRDCEGHHRRDFLKLGSAGLLGLSLPEVLRWEAAAKSAAQPVNARAKSVILVWLAGGPPTIDMWDNKPEAPEGIRGEFKSISTNVPGIELSECLPQMAQVSDRVSYVRSLYHTIPSHAPATVFMTTGNKPTQAVQYPSMGSIAAKLLPAEQGVPPYVTFSQLRNGAAGGAGYLGTSYNPFVVDGKATGKNASLQVRGITLPSGFTLDQLDKRNGLLNQFDASFRRIDENHDLAAGLDSFHQQAVDILRSDRTKTAFDLDQESESLRDRYGRTNFGQGCLAARRLVEAGVRFVTISTGGWDTHSDNFKKLKTKLLPDLDMTLSALIADLGESGLLDETIVMCAGEFGRTPKINKKAGRDHWARSMACVLAGGGIKQGYVHGSTNESGTAPKDDPVTPDDLGATIFTQLGLDPMAELMTPTGRPIQLFREGRFVEGLIG